jgi:anti-sigma28 factor (negative regulator of flagellin synthesis)
MIGPIDNKPIRLDRSTAPGQDGGEDKQAAARPRQADRVEISAEARQRAAELDTVTGLSPERLALIRKNLADGTYSAPEVLDAVARRIIEQGEL